MDAGLHYGEAHARRFGLGGMDDGGDADSELGESQDHVKPVHVAELEVEEDAVGCFGFNGSQKRSTGAVGFDGIAGRLEDSRCYLSDDGIVVDDRDYRF